MKRRGIVVVLWLALLWAADPFRGWTRNNPTPGDEYTFETSRNGFGPISYPGPLTYNDFVRLLLRHEGGFHLPLTANFREWRLAEPPDLWELDLPPALKVSVSAEKISLAAAPRRLRLGRDEVYPLPLIFRSAGDEPLDVKLIATFSGDEAGPADRFRLRKGLNYAVLNLRPWNTGEQQVEIRMFAGRAPPPEGSPPESRVRAAITIPAEVTGWGTLRLQTLNEHGKPAPARVFVRGSDGRAYAPDRGALSRITWTAGDYFFYSAGEHPLRLPAGEAEIEVVRGFEYEPVQRKVTIRPGQSSELRVRLQRISNLGEKGWYGGDVHIHANYNDHEFITPSDVLLQARGEDLHVANLMVANSTGAHIHDEQYFEGRPHRLSTARRILYWVEEMRNGGVYGHMCLIGLRSLVKPLYTGFSETSYPYDYPPNHAQALAATKQGGAASYAHPGYRFTDRPSTMSARELPVDLALGSVQAMDVMSNSNEQAAMPYWYRLLNAGLQCAISAGSDSFTNRRHHWIPGGHRVYVESGPELDYARWVAGFREGRSFATNGPLLEFTVNGKPPGSELDLGSGGTVKVKATAVSIVPMDALEIVRNGEVVAAERSAGGARELALETEIEVHEGSWIAARAGGPFHRYLVNDSALFAHSSPVYCRVNGRLAARRADARFFMGWIDRLIESVRERGKFESDAQRQEVVRLFLRGRAYYEKVAADSR